MSSTVKIYDGSEDLEDLLKIFQAAAKVERWAMPTWCHMFNSTLTGSVRRFNYESRHVKEAPECMKVLGFMHGVTNPELIKHLHDNISKSVDEMMRSPSPYNGIIERPWVKKIQAVLSTAYGMLKLPVSGGILTLRRSKIVLLECTMVSGPKVQHSASTQVAEERIKVAVHSEYLEQTIAIGSTLIEDRRKELYGLLRRNLDVFTWKLADMTGVPRHIAEHHLNVHEGYAYKGYHQIKMAKEHKEKTAFITNHGIFYYLKMPFGLKNARATYQCLVDKEFQKQIGINLEVFIDDLVIKSHTKCEIIRDIEETFKTVREINMMLNPKKCTFGVEEVMFLGYMVNTKGIKVCPDKVEAVLSLSSLKCLKDVQRLNGKLASMSKSAEKSLPGKRSSERSLDDRKEELIVSRALQDLSKVTNPLQAKGSRSIHKMAEQDTPPPTITAMKIPIIKKGEYDIWSMRMRQYICHTNHNLWDIIVNGDLEEEATPAREQPAPSLSSSSYPKTLAEKQLTTAKRNKKYAKSLWATIKSRFRGNDESKKMQKNVLKYQFENFTTTSNESLDKAYDRFQKLISQLEVHGALVSKEDINQKFLRSLPPSWSQIALILRNKPDIDQVDIDDLYNNLRVYEDEMKKSLSSTLNSQNLAFLSSKNTSNTNEVSTSSRYFRVSTGKGTSLSSQISSTPCADEVMCSFFAQQTSPQLQNKDLQPIYQDNLEALDLRWQVAMLAMLTIRGTLLGNANQEGTKGEDLLVIIAGAMHQQMNLHLKHCSSSSSDNENTWTRNWGEKFKFQNYELKCIELKINKLTIELENVVKERDELEVKIEKWEESSKGLNKLLNSQMSAHDKNGLGYGTLLDEMSNKSETDSDISMSIFEVRSSDEEITPANDRFPKAYEYHDVPPPIIGNFLTPRADISFAGKTNEVNIEKPMSVYKSVVPKPKISRDKVIIEDWNSDDEDDVLLRKYTDHLIKDCNFYDKKSPEPKLKIVGNTGQRVVKPVWDNAKRVNHKKISNKLKYPQARRTFIPSGVLTRTGLINPVRPNGKGAVQPVSTARPIDTARSFAPKIAQTGSAIRPIYPRMDNVRPRASYSLIKRSYFTKPAFKPKDLKQDVKISRFKNMNTAGTRTIVNTGKGKMENALKKSSFKLLDESQVVLRASRQNDVYSLDLKNIVPSGGITCLYANATSYESKLGHRRLGHVNFKNINKLVKGHLVRGLPSKVFVNDHTYVACKKGKQHKASCKAKLGRTIRKPLELFHMDLFELVSVESINKKKLENQLNHKVKIIRCDHGTEFKNYAMNELCAKKGIKREFSVAGTPQQNGVTERKNRTLIKAARTIFDGKSDKGYLLGYSTTSKAFRVYNKRTKRVEENLHIDFLEDQPNVAGTGPNWMFDLDFLTNTMNYILVSVENQVNVDADTQDSYVAGSSGKDKEPTQEYILLPLHPHRTRIPVEYVASVAHEKPYESSPIDNGELDLEDIAAEQALKDNLERMVAQEMAAQAVDDVTRQAFEEEKRKIASQKRAAQATSINKLSTGRSSVSTATTPYVSAASTPTGANASESSFVYLGGKIPIDASTLPNADLPIDPTIPDLEDDSDAFSNDGIFNGAYNDKNVGAVADFNNMDDTINVDMEELMDEHMDEHDMVGQNIVERDMNDSNNGRIKSLLPKLWQTP
ncbi:ribonuclease H-like domain-containing protein [Tanacetum coccineum]